MTTVTCAHQYSYGGVRYCDGVRLLPGGGASRRYYAHVYYCIHCTECKGDPIPDLGDYRRPRWTSYDQLQFNATPGTPAVCGVPLEDQ
jgi:hypothetical protein